MQRREKEVETIYNKLAILVDRREELSIEGLDVSEVDVEILNLRESLKEVMNSPSISHFLDEEDEECDHSDVEDAQCLICGEDLTEDMAARAYDMYKDSKWD